MQKHIQDYDLLHMNILWALSCVYIEWVHRSCDDDITDNIAMELDNHNIRGMI